MIIAVATAVPLLLAGALVLWTAIRANRRTLPMNYWIGIRTTATLRSEDAWMSGHAAAARPLAVGGLGLVVAAIAALVVGDRYAIIPAMVGCAWIVICLMVGSAAAGRATRPAPGVDGP